jgi:hypothetical protein
MFVPMTVMTSFVVITLGQHYFLRSRFLSQWYNGVGEYVAEFAVRRKVLLTRNRIGSVSAT